VNPLDCKPDNIWNYKQNKPSLIAQDMAEIYGVPPDGTLKILMARGVFKWLRVRREIIKLKAEWKNHIKFCHEDMKVWKNKLNQDNPITLERVYQYNYGYTRGKLEAYTKCRNEVRGLCHSERWTCPDFDTKAMVQINAKGSILFAEKGVNNG